MTEIKGETAPETAKELLALNPTQESEFRKKVQEVKKNKSKKGTHLSPGVIYVGHLPRGLFEPQLKAYFEQFGKVLRLRLSRSKKTGKSKGYAFIEFDCDDVAKIVAETMNNYLMGERLIKCHVVPEEKVHAELFVGSQEKFRKPRHPATARYNRNRTQAQIDKMKERLLRKEGKLRKRLAAHGIEYDFPGFAAQLPQKKKSSGAMNESSCSEDATPVCTPSVLEKRKSMVVDDNADDEVVVKMPAGKNNEEESDEEDSEEEEDSVEMSEEEEEEEEDDDDDDEEGVE
ncbi:hypothetical protein fugu_000699 [Takifugu bimaculatus]|uniref:RRM domain-containing protein n=1 Tax=Takifugu bimaculatus TaxID=433685 RepID=A0A4Z2CHT3_9TELE|nr:hypothetical protein fugu_000699 [Takifugu bimaculatus]